MQLPTCRGIRIRSTHDAHRIIRAVELGVLPITQRRLDGEERKALRSGDVWVWEERGTGSDNTGLGIERWTDGRTYGPSRVRDDFLFYSERDQEPFQPSAPYAAQNGLSLVKQTYSVFIRGANGIGLPAAYFSQATVEDLATVDHMPSVARIPVPDGRYTSARSNKHKGREEVRRPRHGSDSSYSPTSEYSAYTPFDMASGYSAGYLAARPRTGAVPAGRLADPSATLVPLSYLQNPSLNPAQRYPEDEKVLRTLTFGA